MKYWYVDGSLRKGDWVQGAIEISAAQFDFYSANLDTLMLFVRNGRVVHQIDMAAYRRAALAKLENKNFVVVDGTKYFDDELGYLSENYIARSGGPCRISKEKMIALVTERNRIYTMRRSGIQTARTPEEVDELCQMN